MNENLPYGYYAPKANTRLVRLLTRLGLSRGRVNKWIGRFWKRCEQDQIDHEVRGIKYRLHIKRNVTDRKILTSSSYYEKRRSMHSHSLFNTVTLLIWPLSILEQIPDITAWNYLSVDTNWCWPSNPIRQLLQFSELTSNSMRQSVPLP